HSWEYPRNKAFPGHANPAVEGKAKSFRRARVMANGDLIGIYNGSGMIRLNHRSEPMWTLDVRCHHDLDIGADGVLYTLIQKKAMHADINPDEPIIDELIAMVDPETGRIIRQISIINAFRASIYAPLLKKMPQTGDVLHANTIVHINAATAGVSPLFHENHLLVSLRNMDAIALIDPNRSRVVWALTGMWSLQHEPSILPSGNILIFDNTGHRGRSKILEFDPMTQVPVWQYGLTPDTAIFSSTSGACHRLPNGNTFIIESNRGRAVEVTTLGKTVWLFNNPSTWGPNNNLRGTLFDVVRIPPDFFSPDISASLVSDSLAAL
ncbi:aryl-sulfate sulfotransferase, partial [bacterium]|nr:aryl-sulfate sulfotransferase [candidate division CSSED10-310 bacterium]